MKWEPVTDLELTDQHRDAATAMAKTCRDWNAGTTTAAGIGKDDRTNWVLSVCQVVPDGPVWMACYVDVDSREVTWEIGHEEADE